MGAKKKQQRHDPAAGEPGQAGGPPWILIGGLLAVGLGTVLAFVAAGPGDGPGAADETVAAAQGQAAEPELPVRPAPPPPPDDPTPVPPADAVLPPLPLIPNMVPRSPEVVRAAYDFAAQRPDVLEYVPCYCGCENAGHKRNADCFVAERNPDGTVREWDTHGMACIICVDVARAAMQMHASGASVSDIRSAVEEQYAVYPNQTPTPAAPAN